MGMVRPRVLVVEDNAAVREALAHLLAGAGFAVEKAADGREALERLRAGEEYELVLLDLVMPDTDGWEFLRQRQKSKTLAAVPVIVLTASGTGHEPAARALGVQHFLTKPVESYALLDAVRRHC